MNYLAEQVREWVWAHGHASPDAQWISSPMDTWELNPHYHGPDQPHPESYEWDEDYHDSHYTPEEREDRFDDLASDIDILF